MQRAQSTRTPPLSQAWEVLFVLALLLLEFAGWSKVISCPWGGASQEFALWVIALFISWIGADLASGLVHYFADHFGDAKSPLIGPLIIHPFREHHTHPRKLLLHGFLERNANNALVASLSISWIPLVELTSVPIQLLARVFLLVGVWIFFTNQIHAWAHDEVRPDWVSKLQSWGIILPPQFHQQHHSFTIQAHGDLSRSYARNYCITSGRTEGVLVALVSFARLLKATTVKERKAKLPALDKDRVHEKRAEPLPKR